MRPGNTFNQSFQFVPALKDLHRTPLSGRRLLLALYVQSYSAIIKFS